MDNKYLKFGLSFQVPLLISDMVVALSQELALKYNAKFALDAKNIFPHITIYPPSYPAKNLDKLIASVESFVKNTNTVEMKYYKIESKKGYVMVYFELSPDIKKLHKNIVEILNPLREGYINPRYGEPEYLKRLINQEIEMVQQYGYPYVMDCYYHPHLSLLRLEDIVEAKVVANNLNWGIEKFKVNKLVLHRIGDNGAAIEVVKEFNLK